MNEECVESIYLGNWFFDDDNLCMLFLLKTNLQCRSKLHVSLQLHLNLNVLHVVWIVANEHLDFFGATQLCHKIVKILRADINAHIVGHNPNVGLGRYVV